MPVSRGLVSIVIPVHDRSKLQNCLEALKSQTYRRVEVITVEFPGFPAEKRNFGYRRSKGEFVFFLDEDEYLNPTAIESCVRKVSEGFDVVAIPVIKKPVASYVDSCISIIRESTFKTLFFKREVLERVGLFDGRFVLCDDIDLLQRVLQAGFKIGYLSSRQGYMVHDEKTGLFGVLRKTLLSRRGFRLLRKRYGKQVYNRIVRIAFHRRRILSEILKRPAYLPGIFFVMLLRFLIRRLP